MAQYITTLAKDVSKQPWGTLLVPHRLDELSKFGWLPEPVLQEIRRVSEKSSRHSGSSEAPSTEDPLNPIHFYSSSQSGFDQISLFEDGANREERRGAEPKISQISGRLVQAFSQLASHRTPSVLLPLEALASNEDDQCMLVHSIILQLEWLFDQTDRFKSKPAPESFLRSLETLAFLVETESARERVEAAVQRAMHYARARKACCRLANLPGNLCRPSDLAQAALELAARYPELLSARCYNAAELAQMGLNGLLAVGEGSNSPPYLIELKYKGLESVQDTPPVALVGKGVTFDSGGISIKPSDRMHHMKYDMCGAASLFGVMEGACLLKLKSPIVALIPTCENLLSGSSYRPGDVLKMHSGLTVEVLNTDAEGRLALADALSYAEKTFKPRQILDVATLTGACVVALGWIRTGLISNEKQLQDALLKAGEEQEDLAWPLPFDEGYDKAFESQVADWANCGTGRGAGTIAAARFLSKFVEHTPWAHLDIAGTAYTAGARVRATGRPVALLLNHLENLS